MISFLILTNMRVKGWSSLSLYFGVRSSSPGMLRNSVSNFSMVSCGPAMKRLIPSVLSRMVPFRPQLLHWVISLSLKDLRSVRVANL